MVNFSKNLDKFIAHMHILDWVLAFATLFYTMYRYFIKHETKYLVWYVLATIIGFVLAWYNPGDKMKAAMIKKVKPRARRRSNVPEESVSAKPYNITYNIGQSTRRKAP